MNLKDLNENLPINIPTNFHCQFFKSSIYDPNSFPPQSMALKSSKISDYDLITKVQVKKTTQKDHNIYFTRE